MNNENIYMHVNIIKLGSYLYVTQIYIYIYYTIIIIIV